MTPQHAAPALACICCICCIGVAGATLVAQDAEPATAPTPAAAAPPRDPGRADRLARATRELEAEIAAIDRFGHRDEFLAAVKKADEGDSERWLPTRDGWIQALSLHRYALWATPAEGREKILALDLDYPNHSFGPIVDFHQQLAARGIDLVVISYPARLQIYPELLLELPPEEMAKGFHGMGYAQTRYLLELTRAGVEVIDLTAPFAAARHVAGDPRDQLFLRANVHWTPRGAELGAKVTAERLKQLATFVPGRLTEGDEIVVRPITFDFVEENAPDGPYAETVKGNEAKLRGGARLELLDPQASIVVIGGSFVGQHRTRDCSYAHHLARFTGQPLQVLASRGGTEKTSREELARLADKSKVRIVVWLISEEMLRPGKRWVKVPIFPS